MDINDLTTLVNDFFDEIESTLQLKPLEKLGLELARKAVLHYLPILLAKLNAKGV